MLGLGETGKTLKAKENVSMAKAETSVANLC